MANLRVTLGRFRDFPVALLCVAIALLIRLALDPQLGDQLPFSVFFLAIIAVTWRCGLGPSLFALVLSTLAATWFFVEPRQTFYFHDSSSFIGLMVHVLIGLVICFFGYQMQLGRARAHESAGQIEQQATRLAQEIKQHQESEAALQLANDRLQRVLASLTDAYFMLDRQFRFVELNWAAETGVFGRPAADLIGKCFWDEFPPDKTRDCYRQYHLALEQQQPVHFESQSLLNDRYYEIHVYPSPEYLEIYFRDITDRKRGELALQADLRQANEILGQHVAERTADLLKTERSLHTVTYTIGHDLRAPLRVMHSFTTLLLQRYGPKLDARGQEFAGRIAAAAERMDQLIRDLLAYGEICSLPASLSQVNTGPLVDSLVTDFRRSALGQGAVVRITTPLPPVRGNAQLLKCALEQLLNNAARFVPPGATPQIEIHGEEHDSVARLHVQDNGIGIPPAFHERIFWVFERLSPQAPGGTGIGLAIAQKAVERMHGHIGVESAPGKGSLFWIELPLATPPAASQESTSQPV